MNIKNLFSVIFSVMGMGVFIFITSARPSYADSVVHYRLENNKLQVDITPDIGGRVLGFGLKDHSNFLRVGQSVETNPHPLVAADASNIGYLGLEIWLGPQSEWWLHQTVNASRARQKAVWPPDPFLVQPTQKTLKQTNAEIVLQSDASPVTGVSLQKNFQLDSQHKNALKINVTATNESSDVLTKDIWFNARVFSSSHIYVPVSNANDVRTQSFEDARHVSPVFKVEDGYVKLKNETPPSDKAGRQGKILIQPSVGWIAAFHDHQVFIIEFAWQEKILIHPEQGQVELFQFDEPAAPQDSLTEMEVHAPFKSLKPKETMSASVIWYLEDYSGEVTTEEEMKFLSQLKNKLKLK